MAISSTFFIACAAPSGMTQSRFSHRNVPLSVFFSDSPLVIDLPFTNPLVEGSSWLSVLSLEAVAGNFLDAMVAMKCRASDFGRVEASRRNLVQVYRRGRHHDITRTFLASCRLFFLIYFPRILSSTVLTVLVLVTRDSSTITVARWHAD